MKRDPINHIKNKYIANINIREMRPLYFRRCKKCGLEFKYEKMYECSHSPYFIMTHYEYGCKECFSSKEDFRRYLENKKVLLKDEDFENPRDESIAAWICSIT